jgi:hypothetical protein
MNVSAVDLLDENSKWDEEWLQHYLIYNAVFSNADTRQKMLKHRKRFQEKGIFSAMLEMPAPGEENGQ